MPNWRKGSANRFKERGIVSALKHAVTFDGRHLCLQILLEIRGTFGHCVVLGVAHAFQVLVRIANSTVRLLRASSILLDSRLVSCYKRIGRGRRESKKSNQCRESSKSIH